MWRGYFSGLLSQALQREPRTLQMQPYSYTNFLS